MRRSLPFGFLVTDPAAASKPHITPAASTKSKQPRKASSTSLKRKRANVEKGMERSQKLEKRRSSVEGKKDGKQRAKLLWD